jgi:ribosomal protein S18 acetylase RimI-like enzyme
MPNLQWAVRPLTADDTLGVATLYDRAMTIDTGIGPVSTAAWDRFVAMPQNLAGRDFRVALLDGTIVGLAESSPRDRAVGKARFFKVVVDPAWRRRGLARALLRELLALDDDREVEFHTLVRPDWTAGLAFLAAFGCEVVGAEIVMKLKAPPASANRVDGSILFERIEDVPTVVDAIARVHNAAYASDAGFRAHDRDEMAMLLGEADVWVAREYGDIVGFCMVEPEATSVWIESLAIDPTRQGRGIGTKLIRHVLVEERVGSDRAASLQVSSLQVVARRAYARLGFVETGRQVRFAARRHEMIARMG